MSRVPHVHVLKPLPVRVFGTDTVSMTAIHRAIHATPTHVPRDVDPRTRGSDPRVSVETHVHAGSTHVNVVGGSSLMTHDEGRCLLLGVGGDAALPKDRLREAQEGGRHAVENVEEDAEEGEDGEEGADS